MLIFTPLLRQHAEPTRSKHYRRLIHRWAIDERHEGVRAQLERAAALVPAERRGRVLGPLTGKSSSDDQVRAAAGSLLLAKTLGALGWSVEFEPVLDGGAPDLRITKDEAGFVIEVRSVPRPESNPTDEAIARIQDALDTIKTTTPFSIRAAHVPGNASLKRLATFVRQVLSQSPAPQAPRHTFNEDGVLVVLEGGPGRLAFDEPTSAIAGWTLRPMFGDQCDVVRNAINEKLNTYKVPLIVALDFIDPMDAFATSEQVLLGRQSTIVPVALTDDAPYEPPRAGRVDDGILHHQGADGNRARARLQALLPFTLLPEDTGALTFRGRIMTNPGAEQSLRLREFTPMPRLVVAADDGRTRTLQYLDERDQVIEPKRLGAWQHVP